VNEERSSWQVGELARATGLTVRTLPYYDEIGLLAPSEQSTGGYRLYSGADVERLHRICLLRRIGLPLAQAKAPHTLTVRVPGLSAWTCGQRIYLAPKPGVLHVFDPATGVRV
jgi:hypothetical protein